MYILWARDFVDVDFDVVVAVFVVSSFPSCLKSGERSKI